MATKAKESSTLIGNEKKKTPSSTSHLTTTKRTTKPTTTTTTNKSNTTTTSEKSNTNHPKPTVSLRQPKPETPTKPATIRRRSLDKPLSSSNLTSKQKQPSPSRLHKALVSPGPRQRSTSLIIRSSNVPDKSTNPSKPISDKTPTDAKIKLVWKKATKTKDIATSKDKTLTTDKDKDHASSANPSVVSETSSNEITGLSHGLGPAKDKTLTIDIDSSNVETEDVKEVTDQVVEVIKVDNNEEHISSPYANSELEHGHGHDQALEDSDIPHNQGDDEKVISTVSEEPEKPAQEEKHEVEENSNENQTEEVEVNEKEESENGIVVEEEQKSENNNEEEQRREETERVDEETKVEVAKPKQELAGKGKKESQVSNDMIEETASKLLGRKNKVLALAGAFQTVIDHQTK